MERYKRQRGLVNQNKLKKLKVAVCGLGGLGSTLAYELAGLGVGNILLVDKDNVEITDLNRQFLYTEKDIGKPKAKIAARKLREFNSEINICYKNSDISKVNFSDRNIVFSCLDNWKSRFLLDEKSHKEDFILIHGSARKFKGIVYVHYNGKNPCLKEIFKIRKNTQPTRIMCHICTIVSSLMIAEFLNLIDGKNVYNKLLVIDMEKMKIEGVEV